MPNGWNGRLILAPHPDDELLCCSSILKNSVVVIVTRGNLGIDDARNATDEDTYSKMRVQESERVCESYDVFKFISLGLDERDVGQGIFKVDLSPYLKKATQVFCTNPKDEQICHVKLGEHVTEIANKIDVMLYYYAHRKFPAPNIHNILSPEDWERKMAAIKEYKTQTSWLIQHVMGHLDLYQSERFHASPKTVEGVFYDRSGKSFSYRSGRNNYLPGKRPTR